MKITAQTEAVSSPPEEKWHLSQQWRQNTFRAGQKLKADWKYDLHNLGAGRKSRKPPTPFVGMKPYGKSQLKGLVPIGPYISLDFQAEKRKMPVRKEIRTQTNENNHRASLGDVLCLIRSRPSSGGGGKPGGNAHRAFLRAEFWNFLERSGEIPPSPFDPLPQLPVYGYGPADNQNFVYDDRNWDYATNDGAIIAMDDSGLPTPEGGGTNLSGGGGGGGSSFSPEAFTTNDLWLEIDGVTNQTAVLVIHPPWNVTNGVYDLLYTTNLAPPTVWQWVLRTTPGQTNLFVTNATDPQGFYQLGSANTSAGTDFWLAFPYANYEYDFALSLYISGPLAASGTVSIAGLGFTQSFSVMPGVVTNIAIPINAMLEGPFNGGPFGGPYGPLALTTNGVHVTASQPVSVYGVEFYPQSSAAFTGYPLQVLGTNYCVLDRPGDAGGMNSQFAVLATANDTTVTITPSTNADLANSKTNSYTETLQQGETYQMNSYYDSRDVTGTLITSDNPIAVFAGPNDETLNDGDLYTFNPMVQEQLPISAWGNQILALSFASRTGGDVYRVLAVNSNTVVNTNGVVAATLQPGQFYETIIDGAVQFQGSNPIQVAQFANGPGYDNPSNRYGGVCEILLPSAGQYSTSYTVYSLPQDFVTGDFTNNFLNIIVTDSALSATTLDTTNVNLITTNFVAIGSSGYSGAQIPVSPGAHTVSSSQPVEVEVYGFGYFDAYGYIGGVMDLP